MANGGINRIDVYRNDDDPASTTPNASRIDHARYASGVSTQDIELARQMHSLNLGGGERGAAVKILLKDVKDAVKLASLEDSKRSMAGMPVLVGYDVLERRVPRSALVLFESKLEEIFRAGEGNPFGDCSARVRNLLGFMAGIGGLAAHPEVSHDEQLFAIALGHAYCETMLADASITELDAIATIAVKVVRSEAGVINPEGNTHKLQFGREVLKKIDAVGSQMAKVPVAGTAAFGLSLGFLVLPLAAAVGTLAAKTTKEHKPENKLMQWAMPLMERIDKQGAGLSDALVDACVVVMASGGGGTQLAAFDAMVRRLATAEQTSRLPPAS